MSLFNDPRADAAQQAVDHVSPGLGVLNPWTIGIDFDPNATAQIQAQGGATIVVNVGAIGGILNTLAGNNNGIRCAFLWDDTTLAAPVETVKPGTQLVAQVGPPAGSRLTLWMDVFDDAQLVSITTPDAAAAILAKLGQGAGQQGGGGAPQAPGILDTITNALSSAGNKFLSFETTTTQTAIVVLGLVLFGWLVLEGPSFKKGGGA